MIRTTVRLDENLFKEARKVAIDKRMAFAAVVQEALSLYLGKPTRGTIAKKFTSNDFLLKLTGYKLKGGPKDLARKHDKYTWE
ncbi:MAG: hypothetical protein HYT07_00655 [Candidatus Levybacteria bacterium]|nr:hypothetical protein [Candidatus Levybacteria bacterium]